MVANNQAPVVVPRLAPKIMPIPVISGSKPALKNEIVITDTRELDCMMAVLTMPKPRLFGIVSVVRRSTLSRKPPVNWRNPFSSESMPNRKMATPAAICLNSGLNQSARARIPRIRARKSWR